MTLKEYLFYCCEHSAHPISEKELLESTLNSGRYDLLNTYIFPAPGQLSYTGYNYLPFKFTEPPSHGGQFAGEVCQYIGENYLDNKLNSRYYGLSENVWGVDASALQNKVGQLLIRYKYKWESLYNSMILDDKYNPLDNVEEHSVETVRRTPDLTFSESGNINHGQISVNNSETVGQKTISVSNMQGEQSNSTSETIGTHTDSKTFTNGATDTTTTNEQGVYAFDDNTSLAKTGKDTSHVQTLAVTNGESNSYGAQSNSKSDTIGSRTDSSSETHSGQNNSSSSTTGSHTDTSTLTKSETGSEVTTYEKSRHGNIGVTMATQLIEAYRNLHYFDLVKIIANDIINEILDLNFFS